MPATKTKRGQTQHGGTRRNSGRKPSREPLVSVHCGLPPIAVARLDELGTRRKIGSELMLEMLARKLERRRKFFAFPLSVFAGAQEMDRADLAVWLDINEHELAKLACITTPTNSDEIEAAAAMVATSAEKIAKVIDSTRNAIAKFVEAESEIIASGSATLGTEGLNRFQFDYLAKREGWTLKWSLETVECWISG